MKVAAITVRAGNVLEHNNKLWVVLKSEIMSSGNPNVRDDPAIEAGRNPGRRDDERHPDDGARSGQAPGDLGDASFRLRNASGTCRALARAIP